MKKVFLTCGLIAVGAMAAELKQPAFRMTEPELLAVLKENALNDKVTACQELGHKGTAACVPALAALLADATEPPLFHAARYGLQNIPGPEAEAALVAARAKVKDAKRQAALDASLRIRKEPVTPGYAGASAAISSLPAVAIAIPSHAQSAMSTIATMQARAIARSPPRPPNGLCLGACLGRFICPQGRLLSVPPSTITTTPLR